MDGASSLGLSPEFMCKKTTYCVWRSTSGKLQKQVEERQGKTMWMNYMQILGYVFLEPVAGFLLEYKMCIRTHRLE